MRIVFLGCTQFSEAILQHLIEIGAEIVGICSIPKSFKISYSSEEVVNYNYADLRPYSEQLGVPYFLVNSQSGCRMSDYADSLKKLNPDVMLVMGWYYMVNKSLRSVARLGAWGIHASLLPKYAGGAPLVWAMIEGQHETGVTLFRFKDGVDNGDIIAQKRIVIEEHDYIKDVYEKATQASKETLTQVLNAESVNFVPQDEDKIEIYPQRSPKDGEIDWDQSAKEIYDFIRAQSEPYPGAWTTIKGKKITIWKATIEEI
ncbi:methionyl-tRNA formyltransferase [Cryomorphaceae bacterium]|nr:methionyl-tRNA formyltransferase [Cryomorphaceae bacterium]